MLVFWFFFFKQKTAYEMRISDWSSDVCSSDLPCRGRAGGDAAGAGTVRQARPDADALAQRRQRRQGTRRRPRAGDRCPGGWPGRDHRRLYRALPAPGLRGRDGTDVPEAPAIEPDRQRDGPCGRYRPGATAAGGGGGGGGAGGPEGALGRGRGGQGYGLGVTTGDDVARCLRQVVEVETVLTSQKHLR